VARRPVSDASAEPAGRLASKGVVGLGPDDYERARRAYIATGTLRGVMAEAKLTQSAAERLLYVGLVELELPPLIQAKQRHARKVVARQTDRERELRAAVDRQDAETAAAVLAERAEAASKVKAYEAEVLGSAVESRADELRLVKMNRQGAIVLAGVTAQLLVGMQKLSEHLATIASDPAKLAGMHPRDLGQLIRTGAGVVHRAADTARIAVQMERLLMGEPTAIVENRDGMPDVRDMSVDDASKMIELASKALARRKQRQTVLLEAASQRVDEEDAESELDDADDAPGSMVQ